MRTWQYSVWSATRATRYKQAVEKATTEYKKYKARTLSEVEKDYLDSIKVLEQKTEKK